MNNFFSYKQILLLFFFFISILHSFSQPPKYVYYFNPNLESVSQKSASILGKGYQNASSVLVDYYKISNNKMILTIEYKDSSLQITNGVFQSYYDNGLFQDNGYYINGKEDGIWLKYDSAGHLLDSINYLLGKEMSSKKQTYYPDGKLSSLEVKDSIQQSLSLKNYDSTGKLVSAFQFPKGDEGIATYYEEDKTRNQILHTQKRTYTSYKGNGLLWRRFLEQNLNAGIPSDNHAPAGTYTIIAKIVITKDGDIKEITYENPKGYGMEKEVTRIIMASGKWEPATRFGYPIESYVNQPVTFLIQE